MKISNIIITAAAVAMCVAVAASRQKAQALPTPQVSMAQRYTQYVYLSVTNWVYPKATNWVNATNWTVTINVTNWTTALSNVTVQDLYLPNVKSWRTN